MVSIINIESKLSVPEYSQYQMPDNQIVSHSHSTFDQIDFFALVQSTNEFLSPSKQSRLGIKIVLINITNGTTAVVASGFQRPLFNFHANSIDGSVTR